MRGNDRNSMANEQVEYYNKEEDEEGERDIIVRDRCVSPLLSLFLFVLLSLLSLCISINTENIDAYRCLH